MMGKINFNGKEYELRDHPYRDDNNNLICPLKDGTNIILGNAYPVSLHYEGLDYSDNDIIELTYSARKYKPQNP